MTNQIQQNRRNETMEVQEVKHIVSTARDLLVGKVPLPVDQCQEITRALIYKFLSAEDATSVRWAAHPVISPANALNVAGTP